VAQFDSLQSVVDYAIQREQEAVDFYSQLAEAAQLRQVTSELRKIAAMEEGHRDRLRALDVAAIALSTSEAAGGVRIADYVIDDEPGPKLIWQEVLDLAIRREQASRGLYTALGRLACDETAKGLFETLAGEEDGHRAYFQKIYDEDIFAPAEGPG
jgi:rubrerythrin